MRTKTIKAGSKALLTYPEGDADQVQVLSLTETIATVRVVGTGEVIRTVPEDIGIGVDDTLVPVYDAGLCQHVQYRRDRQSLQCQRVVHGFDVGHLHTVALGWDRSSGRALPVTKALGAPIVAEVPGLETEITLTIRIEHDGPMVPSRMLAAMARHGIAAGIGNQNVTAIIQSAFVTNQRELTPGEEASVFTVVQAGFVQRAGVAPGSLTPRNGFADAQN